MPDRQTLVGKWGRIASVGGLFIGDTRHISHADWQTALLQNLLDLFLPGLFSGFTTFHRFLHFFPLFLAYRASKVKMMIMISILVAVFMVCA